MSPQLVELITEVVSQFVEQKRLFTAYEVSKEVQRLGKDRNIDTARHLNMRDAVHDALLGTLGSGDYRRVLQDVGAPSPAFVYYPATNADGTPGDPTKYVPIFPAAVGTAIPAVLVTPVAPATAGVAGGNSRKLAGDRLNIQSYLCRAAGFNPGDTAYVTDEDPSGTAKPCLVILNTQPGKPLCEYKVTSDGRIRVTPAMLKLCGVNGDTVEIEGDNGRIVVKPK